MKVTRDELFKAATRAAQIVRRWPIWKQNLLRDSLKPRWEQPRKPRRNQI